MCWALRFGLGMGVAPIDSFQVCLKSLPNFYGDNPAAFRRIFVRHSMPNAILTKLSM